MQAQNLTRGQKLFRTVVLDLFLMAAVLGAINSFVSLAVTGKPTYWFLIAVSLFFAFVALKLRPFDDVYRTAARSFLDKC